VNSNMCLKIGDHRHPRYAYIIRALDTRPLHSGRS
jgi:hypothetical protein